MYTHHSQEIGIEVSPIFTHKALQNFINCPVISMSQTKITHYMQTSIFLDSSAVWKSSLMFDHLAKPCHLLKSTSQIRLTCQWVDFIVNFYWEFLHHDHQSCNANVFHWQWLIWVTGSKWCRSIFLTVEFSLTSFTPSAGSCLSQHSGRWFSEWFLKLCILVLSSVSWLQGKVPVCHSHLLNARVIFYH